MKTILLLITLVLSTVVLGQSTETLVLTKKKNGKEKTINVGTKIRLVTKDDNIYKGNFLIKNDSLIIPEQCSIALNQVAMLSKISLGRKIIGGSMATFGALTTLASVDGMVNALDDGWGGLAYVLFVPIEMVTVAISTTGVVLITGKKYKSSQWDYEVRKLVP